MREGESMKKLHLLKEGKKEEKIGPKKGRTERWNGVFVVFLVWLFVVVLCDMCFCVRSSLVSLVYFCVMLMGEFLCFQGMETRKRSPTLSSQFKRSLELLMRTLSVCVSLSLCAVLNPMSSKSPWWVKHCLCVCLKIRCRSFKHLNRAQQWGWFEGPHRLLFFFLSLPQPFMDKWYREWVDLCIYLFIYLSIIIY